MNRVQSQASRFEAPVWRCPQHTEQCQTSSENSHGFEPVVFLSEENRRIFQQPADIAHDLEQLGDNPKKCTETMIQGLIFISIVKKN
jgi:dTDP-4-dehydrorhamnose 3,5-epimerase-like enzyme